jgi:hypothetical protein
MVVRVACSDEAQKLEFRILASSDGGVRQLHQQKQIEHEQSISQLHRHNEFYDQSQSVMRCHQNTPSCEQWESQTKRPRPGLLLP